MRFALYIFVLFIALACANQVAPTGGDKDTDAPQIIEKKSTPNFQTNFTKQDIIITFDEWVQLKDIFNQLIISPPLEKNPKISVKGKSVLVEFDEETTLRDSATYTINFGEAIRDITESNPIKNFRFVFATGPQIDSLQLRGRVYDAASLEPVEEAVVMLYENAQDSAVFKERPFYFAKTQKNGSFEINNVKKGRFKVFALQDQNLNYLFDNENENIGFLLEEIEIGDSTGILKIPMFKNAAETKLTSKSIGKKSPLRFVVEGDPHALKILNGENLKTTRTKDSLIVWIADAKKNWHLVIENEVGTIDSVKVKKLEKDTSSLSFKKSNLNSSRKILPGQSLKLDFNHYLINLDSTAITLSDSVGPISKHVLRIDTSDGRQLCIEHKWKEGMTYKLRIFPNAMTNIQNNAWKDSFALSFSSISKDDLATLKVDIDKLVDTMQYVFALENQAGEVVWKAVHLGSESFQANILNLPPETHTLRVIEDRNRNGKFDVGNYLGKLAPENIILFPIKDLRANWEKVVKESIE